MNWEPSNRYNIYGIGVGEVGIHGAKNHKGKHIRDTFTHCVRMKCEISWPHLGLQ